MLTLRQFAKALRSDQGRFHRRPILLLGLLAFCLAAVIFGVVAERAAKKSESAGEGSATLAVAAPGEAQALNTPFDVTVSVAAFTPGASATWGGYDLELSYNRSILIATADTRGLCSSDGWANTSLDPSVVSGCFLQSSTLTGTIETISFTCISNGVAGLTFVPRPGNQGSGTALYDENAVDFVITLQNNTVTCGTGVVPSTNTPTNTATPTATATPCGAVCPTPAATNTPGAGGYPPPTGNCVLAMQTTALLGEQTAVSVTVRDESGALVNGATVEFSIAAQPGTDANVAPSTALTDAFGVATATLAVGSVPGIVQVHAVAPSVSCSGSIIIS